MIIISPFVLAVIAAWWFIMGLWLGYILWGPRPERRHIVSQWYDIAPTKITAVWTYPDETTNTLTWRSNDDEECRQDDRG